MTGMIQAKFTRPILTTVLALALVSSMNAQEDAKPASTKMIPGPFRALVIVDNRFTEKEQENGFKEERNRKGHVHCSFSEHGLKPFVAVIARYVPDENDPLFNLLQTLDSPEGPAEKYRLQRMGLFAIFPILEDRWLHDDSLAREARVGEVNKLGTDLNANRLVLSLSEATVRPTGVGDDKMPSPKLEKFGIDNDTQVTVIFSHNLKEIGRWDFTNDEPITNAAIEEILKSIDTELEPLTRGRRR